MATSHVNVGHAPSFHGDGSNFDYWKTCMRIILKAMGGTLCKVVDEGFVILNEANPTQADNENILSNAQAMNVIICTVSGTINILIQLMTIIMFIGRSNRP
jgi:hypothetical protein